MNTADERTMRKQAKLGPLCMAKIISALLDGPCTAEELVHASGLARATIYAYMRAMRKEHAAHVSGWEPDRMGRDAHMIYSLGRGKDKPRKARTQSENVQAYKARQRTNLLTNAFHALQQ